MIKSLRHAARRPISAMLLLSMVVLMFALAACGGDAAATGGTAASGGTGAAAMTVTIKESKGASGDVYACDPTTLTVKKGDSVTFTNSSDEQQTFTGDAQKAGVTLDLAINASSTVTFGTAGTFMLESGKKATIAVTVS